MITLISLRHAIFQKVVGHYTKSDGRLVTNKKDEHLTFKATALNA